MDYLKGVIWFATFKDHLSLVTRKPVFGLYDQVRLKLAYYATETSYSLDWILQV